jgi:maltooligosyltrehalose trehalohydrolase
MTTLRIWAPAAGEAFVETGGERRSMHAIGDGWWELGGTPLGHGTDYAVILDRKKPVADPRSSWQPFGPEGPSRILDHALFSWTDSGWQTRPLSSSLIYEIHTGTFSPEGTFGGIEERLDHLLDLGVTHIELMPVNGFPGSRGWGYDGVNLYAPYEPYGGPEGLKHLVDTCHGRGMGVILDVVYNHLGPAGNYLDWFGPYYSDRYQTPWGRAINFDAAGSHEVRRFFCDNALMWLRDYHFDGLRLDAVHAIYDRSAIHFLEQLAGEVHDLESRIGRHLFLIAESDLNDPRVVQRQEVGGYGIHAQWSDDFRHSLHAVLTGERGGYHADFGALADLAKALKKAFVYDGRMSRYRNRCHGRPVRMLSGHSFLGYLQNHDQIGNRAKGERSSHLMGAGRLKIAAALVLTSPFIPMLFQGEEWGASTPFQYFTDHQDRELGRAISQGRQKEFSAFGWNPEEIPDPQAVETFERSRLRWEERDEEPHRSILEWHRELIRLRRRIPALADGCLEKVEILFDEKERWLLLMRGPVAVACNLSSSPRQIQLPACSSPAVLLASDPGVGVEETRVRLAPDSVAVVDAPRAFFKACAE